MSWFSLCLFVLHHPSLVIYTSSQTIYTLLCNKSAPWFCSTEKKKKKKKLFYLLFPLSKILIFSLLSLYLTHKSNYCPFSGQPSFSLSRFSLEAQSHLHIGHVFTASFHTPYGMEIAQVILNLSTRLWVFRWHIIIFCTLLHYTTIYLFQVYFLVLIPKVHIRSFECKISLVIDIDSDADRIEQCL